MPSADRADDRYADSARAEAQGPKPEAQRAGVRLAWFTPLPPTRSGIAAYSAEVLPHLARTYEVDTYIDPRAADPRAGQPADPGFAVFPSRDFSWRHRTRPYDLVVYQLGNAPCHQYMWPYIVRYPGLVVLHDAQLHHSRATALLTAGQQADYRAEFAFCHPDANPRIAEMVVAGRGGSLFFLWPLMRVPIEASRLVAVHSPWLASDLAAAYPHQAFNVIRMGVSDPLTPESGRRTPQSLRARHGIAPDEVLFAAYGLLTPEKRLTELLKGLRAVVPYAPRARLLLVGDPVDYYDVAADARAIGVADRVTIVGYVPDDQLAEYLAASDVCMCLRWPTSRETSASWMRCMAAGKPTVITDLAHTTSVPALDPRSWTVLPARLRFSEDDERSFGADGVDEADESRGDRRSDGDSDVERSGEPVCVAIDIVDEQHSLGLAMRRLACDGALRRELGTRAREYWRRHHTTERMAEDYRKAIEAAIGRPVPSRDALPEHLFADGTALTKKILGKFGLSIESLGWSRPGP